MKFLLLSVLCLGLLPWVAAQSRPSAPKRHSKTASAATHKLIDIKVTGPTRYSPAAIIATAGLKLGQTAAEDTFKEAAGKLGETGLFTNVAYSFSFDGEGTRLQLQLADNEKLVPVEFDNLVWYSRQELIDKIRASIPLFDGQVPAGSGLVDQVADLLSVLLAQKNPQLHLDYLRSASGPNHAIVFSVTGTEIRINQIEFPGASSAHLPALTAASKKIVGADFQSSTLATLTKLDLEPIYRKDGYLKATFAEPRTEVVSDKPDETVVNVKLAVSEGPQYNLGNITFKGNSAFPADKLRGLIHAPPANPVNEVQLKKDCAAIQKLYATKGRVKASLVLEPEFDDSQHRVSYLAVVNEGDVFKLGEVVFEGVDDKAVARMREDWKLPEGEIYDSSYPQTFSKHALEALPKDGRWSVAIHESVNDQESTVDVTLTFSRQQ
jgi:outer membrane protein insertion porin family